MVVTKNDAIDAALVSIIIPAYNAAKFLASTLESCLAQTHSRIEVIVVDDGSIDSTASVADAFRLADSRVICLSQPNRGQCAARNLGLTAATGEWVWFLDSDDLLFPWAVQELKALALRTNTKMAIGNERGFPEEVIDVEFKKICSEGPTANTHSTVFPSPWDANKDGGYSFNSVITRTDCVRDAGGFDEQLRAGEEFNINCRMTARCDSVRVVKALDLSVMAKRLRKDSLAMTSRERKSPPWSLLSAAASLQVINDAKQNGLDEIRAEIRDNVYAAAICAYRNGHRKEALESVVRVPAHQILRRVTPKWHAYLHMLIGFRSAEALLLGLTASAH
jgi:hypothetical protein